MDSNHDNSFVTLSSYNRFRRKTSVKRRTRIKNHASTSRRIVESSSSSGSSSSFSPPPTPKSKKKKKPIKLAPFQIFSSSKPTPLQSVSSILSSPLIFYSFSEIYAAIKKSAEYKLSTSSWRATLRDRQVLIFRRKFLNTALPESNLSVIFRSHHRSLVELLGASLGNSHIFIVYDHSHAGTSLKDSLQKSDPELQHFSNWMSRMQIALDVANGLDYIHHHCRLIHHEINSSNVIVTTGTSGSCCSAEICLFGAAYVAHTENKRAFSKKSDVFDFGVMILELVSGKTTKKENVIIELARDFVNKGKATETIVDRMLWDSFPEKVAEKLIRVALKCVEPEQDNRPEMVDVAAEISKLHVDSKNWEAGLPMDIDIFDLIRDHIIVKPDLVRDRTTVLSSSNRYNSDSDAIVEGR